MLAQSYQAKTSVVKQGHRSVSVLLLPRTKIQWCLRFSKIQWVVFCCFFFVFFFSAEAVGLWGSLSTRWDWEREREGGGGGEREREREREREPERERERSRVRHTVSDVTIVALKSAMSSLHRPKIRTFRLSQMVTVWFLPKICILSSSSLKINGHPFIVALKVKHFPPAHFAAFMLRRGTAHSWSMLVLLWSGGSVAKLTFLQKSFCRRDQTSLPALHTRRGLTFTLWYFLTKCGKTWLLDICLRPCQYHRPPLDRSVESQFQLFVRYQACLVLYLSQ